MTMSDTKTRVPTHLSDDEVAVLRSLLLGQLAVHADQAADRRATADGLTGQLDDDSLLERELAEASATNFTEALLETREALRRLVDGSYGICEGCTTPIRFERLEAIPHALPVRQLPHGPGRLARLSGGAPRHGERAGWFPPPRPAPAPIQ